MEIRPNEAINESRLSKDMQMGRTPIREALAKLENDRLVVTHARKGAFAAPVDPVDFRQISLIRQALEPVAAGLAAENFGPQHADDLRQYLKLLRSLADRPLEQSELMRLHLAVHKCIYGLSMNSHLEDTLLRYAHLSVRIWSLLLERQPPAVEQTLELAAVLERIDVPQRHVELAVVGGVEHVRHAERGEEHQLADQIAMLLRARHRRRAGVDVPLQHGIVLEIERRHRSVQLVVRVGSLAVAAHYDAGRQIAGLQSLRLLWHTGVQDV